MGHVENFSWNASLTHRGISPKPNRQSIPIHNVLQGNHTGGGLWAIQEPIPVSRQKIEKAATITALPLIISFCFAWFGT